MAEMLSALRTCRTLLPRNIIFMFLELILLEAEWTPGPNVAERIR
jgi:hypothetical protein